MNREFRFRAWHKGAKEMLFERLSGDVFKWYHEHQDIIIMQFTGLKDKNGKEVYEGDIIQWPHLKSSSPVEVYYNDSEFVFVGRPVNRNEETESWLDSKCEVIGNIYENPELLNP